VSRGSPEGPSLTTPAEPTLLEREKQLSRLAELVRAAREGRGRLILIEAAAGLGKTRLVAAARDEALRQGVLVLSGRASEFDRTLPFGLLRQALRPAASNESLRDVAFEGAAAIVRPLLAGTEEALPAGGDSSDRTLRFFHGLYWLLANLADRQPVLLALDDAHWSDPQSLRFVAFFLPRLHELELGVVVAARPAEPGAGEERALLDAIASDDSTEALSVEPLSESAVAQQLERELGAVPSREISAACREATAGNPFYLRELISSLREEGVPGTPEGAQRVSGLGPAAISRALLVRLGRLRPGTTALARAVAVLGDGAPLRHARELAAVDDTTATACVDDMVAAGILTHDGGLAFSHPIARAAVYADIGPAEKLGLHRRAAELLGNDGADPADVALHLLAAERAGDRSAVETLRAAARSSLARGAPEAAVEYLRRALEEPPAEDVRAHVLFELGAAELRVGDITCESRLSQALELAADPITESMIARELAHGLFAFGKQAEGVRAMERAIAAAESSDRDLWLRLEGERIALGTLDMATSRAARDRVRQISGGLTGVTPGERLVLALASYWSSHGGLGPAEHAIETARRALGAGELLAELTPESPVVYFGIVPLLNGGRFEEAERHLEAALREARTTGSVVGVGFASHMRSELAFWRGDLFGAEAEARTAIASLQAGQPEIVGIVFTYLIRSLTEQGRLGEAGRALEESHADEPGQVYFVDAHAATGALMLAEGRLDAAIDKLREAWAAAEQWGAVRTVATGYHTLLTVALVAAGEMAEASALAKRDLEQACVWGAPRSVGMALHALALTRSGPERVELLEQAVAKLQRSGANLDLARALVELGSSLRRANERVASRGPLAAGRELATECGAIPLAEHAGEELSATGARPRRVHLSGTNALTASERRVARMAGEGMANREIAQALFVTVKTVEKHLGNVYMKLDLSSRSELPAALARKE
jgi:DNA-binding CsgD family transcriptional regulator/tetratricopeptide (TPR) repeat protein